MPVRRSFIILDVMMPRLDGLSATLKTREERNISRALTVDGEPVKLTPTETKIVELLMRHPGRVFPAEEISQKAGGAPNAAGHISA